MPEKTDTQIGGTLRSSPGIAWRGVQRARQVLLSGLIGATCLSPATARMASGQELDAKTLSQRQAAIERMSAAETDRLERNFNRFQSLSEAERDDLRKLHSDLEQDQRNGGHLRDLMEAYSAWLKTLSPGQREDLRRASPTRRAELVRRMREEQEQQRSKPNPPANALGLRQPMRPQGLNQRDLDAVLRVVEEDLRTVLTAEQFNELKSLDGPAKHLFLMEESLKSGREAGIAGYESDRLTRDMIEGITEPAFRNRLLQVKFPEQRRHTLLFLIGMGILSEIDRAKPDDRTRQEFFLKLKKSQQEELLNLPQEQIQERLTRLYMEAHPKTFPRMQPPPALMKAIRQMVDQRQLMLRDGNPFTPGPQDRPRPGFGNRDEKPGPGGRRMPRDGTRPTP